MNRAQRIGFGIAFGLLLVLIVGGGLYLWQAHRGWGGYDVQGRVAGFGQGGRTVVVEHERIPGYMEAMTMPFTATDTSALSNLAIGDAIAFRLHTKRDSAWITGIETLPDSAVAKHPAGENLPSYAQAASASSEAVALKAGEALPNVTLARDQHGEPVHLPADYDGQTLVLTFIYTNCPLPNYCPLMSQNFAKLQGMIPPKLEGEVQLLSVSFDPARDTPKVLRRYGKTHGADFDTWTFATGTKKQVQRVTSLFGVFTQQKGGQIVHNLTTALIGPNGRVRKLWRGNDWTPKGVLAEVKRVAGKAPGAGARSK